jgi:hypothetical protein
MVVVFYSTILLAAIIFGLFWIISSDHEYRDLGFPWWKRPLAIWGFVIAALIVAALNP